MYPRHSANALHAALLARMPAARARVDAAIADLHQALTGLEALARLTGSSDGLPIAVSVPRIAGRPETTFTVSPSDVFTAITHLTDLEAARHSAVILSFLRQL